MSTVTSHARGLVDDAAVFPPGNAALSDAISDHRQHRAAPYADLVGPLLVPTASVDDLVDLVRGAPGDPLGVALVGPASDVARAVARMAATDELDLVAVETRAADATPESVDAAAAAVADVGVPVAIELPLAGADLGPEWEAAARRIGEHGARVKLRTGGVTPDAFPSPAELAAAISTLVHDGLAFKCTAGLHHAVRAEDPDDGLVHHGFLNVLMATQASLDGTDAVTVRSVVEELSGDVLAEHARNLGPDALAEARRFFTAFGSCSILDPVTDLETWRLL